MSNIRPISDLIDKFSDIEETVSRDNSPVFLTKNRRTTMVVMSIEHYEALTNNWEEKLDAADECAASTNSRLTSDEMFSSIRSRIDEVRKL